MRWRKLRFWTALSVLSLVVLFGAWLAVGDLSVLKPSVERWVSKQTGRDFRIAGRFDLDLGRRSILVADDIALGDADWAGTLPMLTVGRLEIQVRTSSLFRGPIIVERLELSDTELHLAERGDGPPNWIFGESAEARDATRRGPPVIVRDANIRALDVRVTAPYRDAPVEIEVDSLRQSLTDDRFVTLTMSGLAGGRRLAAEARLGTWEALLDGTDIEFDVAVDVDTVSFRSAGRIDDLLEPVRPEIRFAAEGPDINDLTRILGLGDKGSGTIDIEGSVGASADMFELRLEGNLGRTRVAATARLPDLVSFDSVDADIEAEGPDLARLVALAGFGGLSHNRGAAESPFGLAIELERRGRSLELRQGELDFAGANIRFNAALPRFPALDDGRIELDARGPDIAALRLLTALPEGINGEFSVDFTLSVDAAQRELFTLQVTTMLGQISADGEIVGGDTYFGTSARYTFELPDAAAAADALALNAVTLPASPLSGEGGIVYVDEGIRLDAPLTATLDGMNVQVGGLLLPTGGLAGSSLTVTADGQSAAAFAALLAASDSAPALPVTARARLDVDPQGVSLRDVSGKLGSTQFSGEARLQSAPGSSLELSLEGPALEELLVRHPGLKFKSGPFALDLSLERTDSALVLNEATLTRPNGEARLEFEAPLPLDRQSVHFALTAEGGDVRSVLGRLGRFEPLPAPYSVDIRGHRDGYLVAVDRFELEIGEAVASASGRLNLRDNLGDTRFDLELDIPDMAALGRVGDRGFNAQPLGVEAEIRGSGDTIEARTFTLRVGDSVVDGLLRYEYEPIPSLDIAIVADAITFEPLLEPAEGDVTRPAAGRKDDRLIPDVALPLGLLDGRKGSLRIDVGRFERGSLLLRDLNVDAVLDDSVLELRDLSFRARSGLLRSTAVVRHEGGTGRMDVELVADDLAFGASESNADLARTADASMKLAASGSDLRALFADLDGAVFIDVRGGRVSKSRFMRALYGDLFNEIVVTINPFIRAEPVTPIECIVVPVDIEDGRISDRLPSFMASDKVQLSIRAAIDLADETLDIGIRSRPKNRLSVSAAELLNPYIKVVGTLAEPELAVDEQGVLITGGAAVATGGLSILARAAWDRLGRAADPCEAARKQAEEALAGRLAELEPVRAEAADGLSDP